MSESKTDVKMTLPQTSTERKEIRLHSGVRRLFPAALAAVSKVTTFGQKKHAAEAFARGEDPVHRRDVSGDHADCIDRHLTDLAENGGIDPESGLPQVYMIAWRALALCQEWCEKNEGVPLAPAARVSPAGPPPFVREGVGRKLFCNEVK